jgi:hypothetical protein
MAHGIPILIYFGIPLNLGKVVAGSIKLIERNPQSPKIEFWKADENFFCHGFGSAVKAAVVMFKAKIRIVVLCEAFHQGRPLLQEFTDQWFS